MDILNMLPRKVYNIQGVDYTLTNLSANVNISTSTSQSVSLFIDHQILDGQSARDISRLLYENEDYYWTIYVINNMTNSVNDWPKSETEIYADLVANYGYEGAEEVITYADPSGNQVDLAGIKFRDNLDEAYSDQAVIYNYNLTPITRVMYANMENANKRQIRLIDPDYISEFILRYKEALK